MAFYPAFIPTHALLVLAKKSHCSHARECSQTPFVTPLKNVASDYQCRNQRSKRIRKSYSRLLKMKSSGHPDSCCRRSNCRRSTMLSFKIRLTRESLRRWKAAKHITLGQGKRIISHITPSSGETKRQQNSRWCTMHQLR